MILVQLSSNTEISANSTKHDFGCQGVSEKCCNQCCIRAAARYLQSSILLYYKVLCSTAPPVLRVATYRCSRGRYSRCTAGRRKGAPVPGPGARAADLPGVARGRRSVLFPLDEARLGIHHAVDDQLHQTVIHDGVLLPEVVVGEDVPQLALAIGAGGTDIFLN
jgi:hypothetical protein